MNSSSSDYQLKLEASLLFLFPIFTLFGNLLVVVSVVSDRYLHNATNYFIVSLAVADICLAVLVMPLSTLVEIYSGEWMFSQGICDLFMMFDVFFCTASIMNLTAISLDRYVAVAHPLQYARHNNTIRVSLTITVVWITSFSISLPIACGLNHVDRSNPNPQFCDFKNADFIVYSSLGSFFLPAILMLVLYYWIFRIIRRQTNSMRHSSVPVVVYNNNSYSNNNYSNSNNKKTNITETSKLINTSNLPRSITSNFQSPIPKLNNDTNKPPDKNITHSVSLTNYKKVCENLKLSKCQIYINYFDSTTEVKNILSPVIQNESVISLYDDDCIDEPTVLSPNQTSVVYENYHYQNDNNFEVLNSPEKKRILSKTFSQRLSPFKQSIKVHKSYHNQLSLDNNVELEHDENINQFTFQPCKRWRIHFVINCRLWRCWKLWRRNHKKNEITNLNLKDNYDNSINKTNLNNSSNAVIHSCRKEKNAIRRERKAIKTLAIVLGAFLFCWTPFFVANMSRAICFKTEPIPITITTAHSLSFFSSTSSIALYQSSSSSSESSYASQKPSSMSSVRQIFCPLPGPVMSACVWLGYINSFLNPVIYTVCNAEFRRVFKRLLRIK